MAGRVALVTGGNQGIGFEIVRQLCRKFKGTIFLAARSAERGTEAVRQLEGEGLAPQLVCLDVSSEESVCAARQVVQEQYNRLDVLVNNAGVLFGTKDMSFQDAARQTIAVNYHGLLSVTKTFLPLLQPNSRIVNLTSGYGNVEKLNQSWQEAILNPELTVEGLTEIMDQFVKDTQERDYQAKGWPLHSGDTYYAPYVVSKIGVNRLTELYAMALISDHTPGILVNSADPGWVRTQLGGPAAHKSTEEGADTPVYLSLLPPGAEQPNGQFIRNRTAQSWKAPLLDNLLK